MCKIDYRVNEAARHDFVVCSFGVMWIVALGEKM